jgi:single-strand DNA-binding protein
MLNQVQIIGRLGKDPELKHLSNGNSVCNFSLATTEKWKDKTSGQSQEKTEWHKCQAFGKVGELIQQYLKQGSLAFIQGKIQTRAWDDKDGKKCYSTEIVVSEVKFLSNAGEKNSPPSYEKKESAPAKKDYACDDIPF